MIWIQANASMKVKEAEIHIESILDIAVHERAPKFLIIWWKSQIQGQIIEFFKVDCLSDIERNFNRILKGAQSRWADKEQNVNNLPDSLDNLWSLHLKSLVTG